MAATVHVGAVTWNLKLNNRGERAIQFLDELAWSRGTWDIACLQEVNPAARDAIRERGWSVVNGLELAWEDEYRHWKRWPHAAAVVARNGWELEGAAMPGTPKPGRGIVAQATKGDASVSVISWHAPNKADEGLATKMAGYSAMVKAVSGLEGPTVAGIDSNHWSLSAELDLPPFDDPDDPFAIETQFFSSDPQHRLRDAFIDYLRRHPDQHEQIRRERPNGPLAVTHRRGKTDDRFDYLFVSEEVEVREVDHLWDGPGAGGSDHGLVFAELTFSA